MPVGGIKQGELMVEGTVVESLGLIASCMMRLLDASQIPTYAVSSNGGIPLKQSL